MDRRSPSRSPRSATRTRSQGQSSWTAWRMAAPARTRSARSGPIQGWSPRSAMLMAINRSAEASHSARVIQIPSTRLRSYLGRSRCSPARLVMAPEVPMMCACPASNSGRRSSAPWNSASWSRKQSTMDRNQAWGGSAPSGNCSARVTTPSGIERQAWMGSRPGRVREVRRSIHDSSVEPPPTSTTRAASAWRSMRLAQPATDRRASSLGEMTSSRRPVSAATRSMNSVPFRAERQAWVAMALKRETPRRRTFSALTLRAARARSMAASDRRPVCESPSPSRTMRE